MAETSGFSINFAQFRVCHTKFRQWVLYFEEYNNKELRMHCFHYTVTCVLTRCVPTLQYFPGKVSLSVII